MFENLIWVFVVSVPTAFATFYLGRLYERDALRESQQEADGMFNRMMEICTRCRETRGITPESVMEEFNDAVASAPPPMDDKPNIRRVK